MNGLLKIEHEDDLPFTPPVVVIFSFLFFVTNFKERSLSIYSLMMQCLLKYFGFR